MRSLRSSLGVLALCANGCASTVPLPTVAYTVRSAGDSTPIDQSLAGASLPVPIQRTLLPNRGASPPSFETIESALLAAREAYVQARFGDCTRVLAEIVPASLVAAQRRDLASRVLVWHAACAYPRVGQAVEKDVQAFADWDLETSPDVQAVSPDVERLLLRMKAKKKSEATGALQFTASTHVRLEIDGQPATCVTPCTQELRYGQHVIAWRGDGVVPGFEIVVVSAPRTDRELPVKLASPEAAQAQWVTTYATGNQADSPASLKLLSTALRSRRLVLLDTLASRQRLYGALVIDGDVVARADRTTTQGGAAQVAPDVMNDLLVLGHVVEPPPPLYTRPLFWAAVVLAAGGAATGAYLLAKPAGEHTEVRF